MVQTRITALIVFIFLGLNALSQSNPLKYEASFLDINNNARLAGFGEVGVVSSPFYKNTGAYQNPALISRNSEYMGVGFSYMPWMTNIVSDLNLIELNGFYAMDSSNAFAINFFYFDQGEITFTNQQGVYDGIDDPYEFYIKIGYTHSFTGLFSAGIAVKYFRSDISEPYIRDYNIVNSVSVDLGLSYDKKYQLRNLSYLNTGAGVAITNLGPKISLIEGDKSFIPTKLAIGLFINPDLNLSRLIRLNIELGYQAEKYLVPTPPDYDFEGNIINGYDPDISSFKALYQSFYDAPDGFGEEINEIKHKFGSELRLSYDNKLYFAFRHGRRFEHETKGNRNYQIFGYGIGAFGFMLDYIEIKSKENANLDNTWAISFGLSVNIDKGFLKF